MGRWESLNNTRTGVCVANVVRNPYVLQSILKETFVYTRTRTFIGTYIHVLLLQLYTTRIIADHMYSVFLEVQAEQ